MQTRKLNMNEALGHAMEDELSLLMVYSHY